MLIILLYIFIALLPGLFWVWFYRRKDRKNPEPLKLIVKVFLWGMLITIPAIGLELAVDYFLPYSRSDNFFVIVISSLFIVAPIEEVLKYFVVREKIYNHPAFDEPVDGVIYAVVAALGFASFENILVVFSEGQNAIVLRFATATLMHALTAGLVGYYLSILKFGQKQKKYSKKQKRNFILQGLAIAIMLHGVYNIIAATKTALTIVLIVIIMIVMYVMLSRGIKELKRLKV
jgi:RsiW-degrading membrane proteinase PrsW (M82 family)